MNEQSYIDALFIGGFNDGARRVVPDLQNAKMAKSCSGGMGVEIYRKRRLVCEGKVIQFYVIEGRSDYWAMDRLMEFYRPPTTQE